MTAGQETLEAMRREGAGREEIEQASRAYAYITEADQMPPLYSQENVADPLVRVKLFTPDAGATWHLIEYSAEERLAFGLCDLGLGYPELGYVSLEEIESLRGRLGLPVERDLAFEPRPLSEVRR